MTLNFNTIGELKAGKCFLVLFLFFIVGLAVYFNSLNNKFLIDDHVFLANPVMSETKFILAQWDPYREQDAEVLDSSGSFGYYRPLAHTVSALACVFFKNNYWEYHILNILLFVFASWLVYVFIEKVTGNFQLAFWAGLFYLVHPINGIAVDYIIPGSSFAFLVIFMLGTILLLGKSLERNNDRVLYFLSLVFCLLSLFWNENGVMIAFYVSAFILLFRQDALKVKILYLLPYFLIIFSYLVFRLKFLGLNENILEKIMLYHLPLWKYPAVLFPVFGWYISHLFYPKGMVMLWSTPVLKGNIVLNLFGAGLLLMVFLLLLTRFSKEKICRLAVIWILIGFAPACLAAFRKPDNGIMIEAQWFAFSSIGFFILVSFFCLKLLNQFKKTGLLLLLALVFFWGSLSYACNQMWADQKTYSLYWLQQVPHLRMARFFLASAYLDEGDFKKARKQFKMMLSMHYLPDLAYNNLGRIDQTEGRLQDAELNYKMALKVNPYLAVAYDDLGTVYYAEDRLDQARENFSKSLIVNPFLLDARIGLASILFKDSQYSQAAGLCFKNLSIVNDDPNTLLLLINIFMRQKDLAGLEKYTYRLIYSESDPAVLMKLGVHLANNNFPPLALDCFTKVLRIDPAYKDVYLAVGTLFANLGQFNEAVHMWELGSKIDPSDQRFKNNIIKAEHAQQ